MAIYITSLLVFMVAIGFTLYQGTKKTVALTIDGEEQVVSTHAKTVKDLFDDLNIKVSAKDLLQPEANTELTAIIDGNELQREGVNKVNIYGKDESGNWTPYEAE